MAQNTGPQRVTQTRTAEASRQKSAATSIKLPLLTGAPVHPVLQLQRTIGNQAVSRLVQRGIVQAKCHYGLFSRRNEVFAPILPKPYSDQVMHQSSEPGEPLDPNTRKPIESRLGYDFSHVRVHPNSPSTATILGIPVRAYTKGHHIHFGAGEYQPQSATGRRLIAHELVHVIQQETGVPLLQGQGRSNPTATSLEEEAEQVSKEVVPDGDEDQEDGIEQFVVEGSEVIDEIAPLSLAGSRKPQSRSSPVKPASSQPQNIPSIQFRCTKTAAEAGYPADVNLTIPPTRIDHTESRFSLATRLGAPGRSAPGLTHLHYVMNWAIPVITHRPTGRMWVNRVWIWLREPSMRIWIASEMSPTPCERAAVEGHESHHDADFRRIVSEGEAQICDSAVGWPSRAHPILPASGISKDNLTAQIDRWVRLESWNIKYRVWLARCAWDVLDYPRVFARCPGTSWRAPVPICPEPPPRPD